MDNMAVDSNAEVFPLLDDCLHYTRKQDVLWDIQKLVCVIHIISLWLIISRYYDQRYSIWSRYDEGIYMTDDSWFGVTPEPVAKSVCLYLSDMRPLADKPPVK
jgi:trimethylguanosine synthase